MSIQERMADAEYRITIPLCKLCKHRKMNKFDPASPMRPPIECKNGLGPPDDEAYTCPGFELDEAQYKLYEPFLSTEQKKIIGK